MEGLPFEKVIVDSRTASSGNGTAFEVTLPETLHLPPNAVCYVTDIAVSHSFYTVEGQTSVGSKNHYLYFLERSYNSGDVTVLNRATLSSKSYAPEELAAELQTQMRAASIFGTNAYTVTYDAQSNTFTIALSYAHPNPLYASYPGFFVINQGLLAHEGFQAYAASRTLQGPSQTAYALNFRDPQDCLGLLGFSRGASGNTQWPQLQTTLGGSPPTLPTTQVTQAVDVRHRHVLYLHSNALSNLRIIGPAGSRSVIARIPVTSLFGGLVTRAHSGHPLDCVPCGSRTLRTLDFQLKDSFAQLVDLHGGHISFELLFAQRPLM